MCVAALAAARSGEPAIGGASLPLGRRGAIGAKTAAQARWVPRGAGRSRTGVRHGSRRHWQDLPGRGPWRQPPAARRGGQAHCHPPRRRSGRTPWLPARRHEREGRSVHGAGVGGLGRHPGRRPAAPPPRQGRDRGGAHRLHARAHAKPRLRHRRRGAERLAPADEDGADPPGRRRADGRDWRSKPDRPGQSGRQRPVARDRPPGGGQGRRGGALFGLGRGAPSLGGADREGL